MTPRPGQPEPFIRGVAYPAVGDVPYPRANPTDTARLPADVWHAASVPVGIRLEVVGDAQAIDVAYRTTTGNLGYRGDGAGITFSVWRGGRKACEEEAVLGDGMIRLSLGSGSPDKPAIIYLPEGMHPIIQSLTAVKGEIAPAPQLPRWIAYGDWTTQGWTASGPSQGWAAIAARKAGLDLINFGYAGAARGEIVSAEHISAMQAAIITVAYGASCWTRVPYSVGMVTEGFRAFLDVVRQGHPTTPIVVVSPIVRPDAEEVPNRLGASMADIRHTIESITRERIVGGDTTLSLVAGEAMISEEHLADGIHPGDEGHKRIASSVTRALNAAMKSTGGDTPSDALIGNALLFGDRSGPGHHDGEARVDASSGSGPAGSGGLRMHETAPPADLEPADGPAVGGATDAEVLDGQEPYGTPADFDAGSAEDAASVEDTVSVSVSRSDHEAVDYDTESVEDSAAAHDEVGVEHGGVEDTDQFDPIEDELDEDDLVDPELDTATSLA